VTKITRRGKMDKARRDMLKMVASVAGGVALTSMVGNALFARKALSKTEEAGKVPELPWPYKKLDPVAVAERAYAAYWKGACCYGAFEGIVGELRQQVGFPYTVFPSELFIFGEGGVAATSNLCGALNGAAAAIFLLTGGLEGEKREKAFKIIQELFQFYEQEPLPNYRPKNPKYEIKPSVSKSSLCHVSVSRWCKVTGFKSFSPQRKERCGWLTASVAKYTVELLNQYVDGTFKVVHPLPSEVQSCRSCHDKGGALENSRGMMDCNICHFTGKTKHP
jgi:hypothetical protein